MIKAYLVIETMQAPLEGNSAQWITEIPEVMSLESVIEPHGFVAKLHAPDSMRIFAIVDELAYHPQILNVQGPLVVETDYMN